MHIGVRSLWTHYWVEREILLLLSNVSDEAFEICRDISRIEIGEQLL